uniref:Uncharacterized protein n=1 Tax=Timema bartmani TaxID=61472 RepID=A0A7R9ENA5_9NEOP|nr:unnamed protein product [Timema bartmani]
MLSRAKLRYASEIEDRVFAGYLRGNSCVFAWREVAPGIDSKLDLLVNYSPICCQRKRRDEYGKGGRCYSSPVASLVLTDSSQLTSRQSTLMKDDNKQPTSLVIFHAAPSRLAGSIPRPMTDYTQERKGWYPIFPPHLQYPFGLYTFIDCYCGIGMRTILGTLKVPSRLNHIAPKPLAESLPRTNGYQLLDYPSRALERSSYNTYNNGGANNLQGAEPPHSSATPAVYTGRYRPVSKIPVARAEPASDPGAVAGITPEDMGHSARDLTFINPVVKRHSALGLGDLLDSSHELTSDQEASIHSCSSARTGGHADKGVSRYLDDLVGWFHFRGVALLRLRTIALTRP